MSDKEPSEEFVRAFVHSGSPVQTCELCGRTNFDMNGEFMEEGELDRLLDKSDGNRQDYHAQDGTISWGTINKKIFVAGCPCDKLSEFENFIWRYRFQIGTFLTSRAKRELKDAQAQSERLADIPQ